MHTLLETLYNILSLVTEDFRGFFPKNNQDLLAKLDAITNELGEMLDSL